MQIYAHFLPFFGTFSLPISPKPRENRLVELTERVAENIISEEKCAKYVLKAEGAIEDPSLNPSENKELAPIGGNGGGGIRTPVPRCFEISFYMLSRLIGIRLVKRQTTGS